MVKDFGHGNFTLTSEEHQSPLNSPPDFPGGDVTPWRIHEREIGSARNMVNSQLCTAIQLKQ